MIRLAFATALLTVATASASQVQPAPVVTAAGHLLWLHGTWEGRGMMFGRPAQVRLEVTPVLAGTATALSYQVDIPGNGEQPAFKFEGRGTYRVQNNGQVIGQWSDSQGNFHPLAGQVSGTSMVINWGEPRTELGYSSYALGTDGVLTVSDSAISRGAVREFARSTYRKRP